MSRERCPHCHRASTTCICALVQTIPHKAEVLILMHPMEVHEAKGTGHLLHLCLPRSQLLMGEQWPSETLNAWLDDDWAQPGQPSQRHSLLLYPDTDAQDASLSLQAAAPLPQPWPLPAGQLRLVIIDGTWRKSRKMLFLNPALQCLPRLALQQVPDSGYVIRKAHQSGQLSSFEATALALAQLESWHADSPQVQALDQVFSDFVAVQMQHRQR
ncbi:MAG: DTW domain-containing protein [Comamonas sp.]|jgi:DTW domain-containing protein YfiP|nr:DTW domain-containing protein [Comamonas sp.]